MLLKLYFKALVMKKGNVQIHLYQRSRNFRFRPSFSTIKRWKYYLRRFLCLFFLRRFFFRKAYLKKLNNYYLVVIVSFFKRLISELTSSLIFKSVAKVLYFSKQP